MKIERIRVFGFEPALYGMRNAKESWDRSDSTFYNPGYVTELYEANSYGVAEPCTIVPEYPAIGPKDLELACSLIKGGGPPRKFVRQIMVWFNITIPRYCWQELDTYKVATVRNSCSTMHKLGHRLLTQADFEQPIEERELEHLNELVALFQQAQKEKSKELRKIRRKLKNDLAEGYLQMATYMLSYETVLAIIKWRHDHRLDEWQWEVTGSICDVLLKLPYVHIFVGAMGVDLNGNK